MNNYLDDRFEKKFNKINLINQHIISMLNRILLVCERIFRQINIITIKLLKLEIKEKELLEKV